jgi:iron-regulated transporter 1
MLPTSSPSIISAITMFTFLSFSRLGLWVFDLTTQEITQIHVPADRRSAFAGIEMSFSSFFELMQYVVSAVVNKPKDFPWLALGGVICVGISTLMYTFWVRRQRGHLLHWDSLRRIAISCSGA